MQNLVKINSSDQYLSDSWHATFWDPKSACRFVAATPAARPDLWGAYLAGAVRSYRRYGVEQAVEYDQIRDGAGTALFFAALDQDNHVVGGLRAQGPYTSADESHAVREWAGHEGESEVREVISRRLSGGVVEAKATWASDRATRRDYLVDALARLAVHLMPILDVQSVFCTTPTQVVRQWQTTGAVAMPRIAPVPYPDDRYRTTMVWWDRDTSLHRISAPQLASIRSELAQLRASAEGAPRIGGVA